MSGELREIGADDIQAALERILAPRLIGVLASHGPGHCAPVAIADAPLAVRLCERVRAAVGTGGQCFRPRRSAAHPRGNRGDQHETSGAA